MLGRSLHINGLQLSSQSWYWELHCCSECKLLHIIVISLKYSARSFVRGSVDPSLQRIVSASIFLHPGFFIVDHIHFQYNGFMYGILLWSILMARNVSCAAVCILIYWSLTAVLQGNKLTSGILFAVLLNFKHIYMYLAVSHSAESNLLN